MNLDIRIFNYLIEQNREVYIDDLINRFESSNPNDIAAAAARLVEEELVNEGLVGYSFVISNHGWKIFNASQEKHKHSEQQSKLEYQKIQLEVTDLINKIADYDTVKSQARTAIWISVATVIITAVVGLLQLMKEGK